MVTNLMVRMNVSYSNALRVVRTEFNHMSNQADLAEYKLPDIGYELIRDLTARRGVAIFSVYGIISFTCEMVV